MSEAHIPQPNTQSAAPAEAFDSTAEAPHGPSISAIGTPAGPPGEITPHTGATNTFDITIHNQFLPIDTIMWSVTQTKGTLLWYKPVHPEFSNAVLSYLQPLYNCWGGSLEYNFKIAGTGFHAGAIAIVRIPPNRKPTEFTTAESWGPFEYCVMDPKMLEIASLEISDQRPITFHYQPFDESNSYSFGGWIAMYVLIPLNTSSTGSQQIAIQAFNRPGRTFQYSQLIYPHLTEPSVDFPQEYNRYFDFTDREIATNGPMWQPYLHVEPVAIQETKRNYNCYDVRGNLINDFNSFSPSTFMYEMEAQLNGKLLTNDPTQCIIEFESNPPQFVPAANSNFVAYSEDCNVFKANNFTFTPSSAGTHAFWNGDKELTGLIPGKEMSIYPATLTQIDLGARALSPKAANESIIHFSHGGTQRSLDCIQVRRITELFKSGDLKTFYYGNMCLLFQIVDKTEDLPVGYAKLYSEGFFTTASTVDQVVFPLQNMKFVYDSMIERTGLIPRNSNFALNRMILNRSPKRRQRF